MAKSNKNLHIWVIVAVMVVIMIIVGVVIKNNNNGEGEIRGGNTQIEGDVTDEDLSSDLSAAIEFSDYDSMESLAHEIQNGSAAGYIVYIDGIVSHPMSKYSIVEEKENGGAKIGTEFIIIGANEEDYPNDGDRITLTGKVVEIEPMYYVIETLPDYIEVTE